MPTLTYDVRVGARAGVSPGYRNPSLRLSEVDPNRSHLLDTYTSPGSISKFGWESELMSFDSFGKLTAGSMSFLKDDSSVSAVSGYGFIPSSQKIKLKTYVSVSASVYKRGKDSDSVYIKYSGNKDDKYHVLTTRVGELDHIEDDSHNHGINLDEVGELTIEVSHIAIPEEKTKVSSDKIIKLDYYPVTNVRVEGAAEYDINPYSGIVTNKSGKSLTVKYNPAPLVVIHSGPATYLEAINPSITLNLLEINNQSVDKIISNDNMIDAKTSFFIESTGPVDIDNATYSAGRKHILPPGVYSLTQTSSEWETGVNSKIAASDLSVVADIKSRLLKKYRSDNANPISYESTANGDVYKLKEDGISGTYSLETVVDNEDRRIILPHLTNPASISVQRVGHRNSRVEVTDYDKDAAGTLKFDTKGRYIIRYTPIKENEWEASNSSILSSIVAALRAPQTQVKVYYGTEENGSVEYLNIDNPIIIGSNNG